MPDELRLTVNGLEYGGWESVLVQRSIENAAGSFEISVSERWPGQPADRPIRPGSRCSVRLGADLVITGYVDGVSKAIEAGSHSVSVRGRDAVGDLIDCSPPPEPGEWLNLTVLDIAQQIATPFGISVTSDVSVGEPFLKASLNPGQTAFGLIGALCNYRALLPVSTGDGNLLLTRAGTARAPSALREGENIEAAVLRLSWEDRFSEYNVRGQSQGTAQIEGIAASQASATALDSEVSRHRPLTVVPGLGISSREAQERASWESTSRAGRSSYAEIVVTGWRDAAGRLWPLNSLVSVLSPTLGLSREMLIVGIENRLDAGGQTTRLLLARLDAFQKIAQPEPAANGIGFDELLELAEPRFGAF